MVITSDFAKGTVEKLNDGYYELSVNRLYVSENRLSEKWPLLGI